MAEWKKVKINSFLKERESRIKPVEANKMGLKRLNKINFSGEIHLVDKLTNTDMILIKRGDLVISGINVEKGAVAVYQGMEDILATIHYSAYIFDETKIDIEYFKTFLKSKAFRDVINSQIRSRIKTELKANKFLSLEINLPDLEAQILIKNKINLASNKISELSNIDDKNESYLSKLRQQILQEAVQGKLVHQNPKDELASELLKKIRAEKEKLIREGKIKKQKPLPPISEDEIPYELPKGWVWCRLGDVLEFAENFDVQKNLEKNELVNYVDIDAIDNKKHKIREVKLLLVSNLSTRARRVLKKDYIAYSLVRPYLDNLAIIPDNRENYIGSTGFAVFKPIVILKEYLFYFLLNPILRNYYLKLLTGFNSPNIGFSKFSETLLPLPPLSEQKRIVEKVDRLMAYCDELEKKVKENKENSEKLMEAVLLESFQ